MAFHHVTIVIPVPLLKFEGFLTFIFFFVKLKVRTFGIAFNISSAQSMIFAFVTSTLHTYNSKDCCHTSGAQQTYVDLLES